MLTALLLAGALQGFPPDFRERAGAEFVPAATTCFDFLAVDPSDSDVLFGFSTAPGDLHRSDDGGATWIDLAGPPQQIVSLGISRIDPTRVLAVANGLYVSQDRGDSWGRAQSAPADLNGQLVFDPFAPDEIYVASNSFRSGANVGELWFSFDDGVHWSRRDSGLPVGIPRSPISGLVASPHEPGVLLVGARDGVYRTHDRGYQWERLSGDEIVPLGFDAASADVTWGLSLNTLFLSQDGGATWEPRTVDCCPGFSEQTDLLKISPDPFAPGAAWALTETQFPGFFFADHLLRTADYGASWQWSDSGIDGTPPTALRDLALSSDGRRQWVADCGGGRVYLRELRRTRTVPGR